MLAHPLAVLAGLGAEHVLATFHIYVAERPCEISLLNTDDISNRAALMFVVKDALLLDQVIRCRPHCDMHRNWRIPDTSFRATLIRRNMPKI